MTVLAFATLLFALFARTVGIHFDENNYLRSAFVHQIGDARDSGKPPLFYALNYALNHTVGFLMGPWRPLCLYFVYAALNAFALAWLVKRTDLSPRRRWFLFAIL